MQVLVREVLHSNKKSHMRLKEEEASTDRKQLGVHIGV